MRFPKVPRLSRRRTALLAAALLAVGAGASIPALTGPSAGAETSVVKGPGPTQVDVSVDPLHDYGEPEIAVNPKNPKNIVYAAVEIAYTSACVAAKKPECQFFQTKAGIPQPRGLFTMPGFCTVGVFTSQDGGVTWTRATVPMIPPGHPDLIQQGDPLLTVSPDGTFYLGFDALHFQDLPKTILADSGIGITTSHDGGRTWGTPVLSGTAADRPFFAADPNTGVVYEASTGQIGGSLATGDPNAKATGPYDRHVTATRDGVHFTTGQPFGGGGGTLGTYITAARGTFASAFASRSGAICGYASWNNPRTCTVFQYTANAGTTWTRHATPIPPGLATYVSADPSTAGRYTITVSPTGKQFLVYQTKDYGRTWTGPVKVAEDTTKTHYHVWTTYSPQGVFGIMWQTMTAGPGIKPTFTVWATISRDGGAGFTRPLEVSTAPSASTNGLRGVSAEPPEFHPDMPGVGDPDAPGAKLDDPDAPGGTINDPNPADAPDNGVQRPDADASASGTPGTDAPSTDVPSTDAPDADAPSQDADQPSVTGAPTGDPDASPTGLDVGNDFSFITIYGDTVYVAWADYRPGERSSFFSAIPVTAFGTAAITG